MRLPLALLFLLLLTGCDLLEQGAPPPTVVPTAAPTAVVDIPPTAPPSTATPAPTLPPEPTATPDPERRAWTVLVYMDADNSLEQAALLDLLEMESAAGSDEVEILVQVDRRTADPADPDSWSEARRYRIRPDAGEGFDGELLEALGEVNMGRPETLVDFLTWGAAVAPANRYALILWDHGAGWFGITYDETTPEGDRPDRLLMPELTAALAQAREAGDLPRLELVGFDGCLMGQLEVLHAIQPHARVAVGSQELIPGRGWDYAAWLSALAADPAQDGRTLGMAAVESFAAYYGEAQRDDFVTLSAVDLDRLPAVTGALDRLATAMESDLSLTAAAAADARSGAEAFARFYREEFERFATIDLAHFAQILARRALSAPVISAAEAVSAAVDEAVVANSAGVGLRQARGISFYFPRDPDLLAAAYPTVAAAPGWSTFLEAYYAANRQTLAAPQLFIQNPAAEPASVQDPAYLGFEIAGRGVEEVVLMAALETDDERQRLLEYDPLRPEPTVLADGTRLTGWQDGLHDDFFIWHPEVTFVTDGENGDFAVLWPLRDGDQWVLRGTFQPRAGGATPAYAVFDGAGVLASVWGAADAGAPYEIEPAPGDTFQVDDVYLEQDGTLSREPGETVTFRGAEPLRVEWRPLPSGSYAVGFQATNAAGQQTTALTEVTVANDDLIPGYRAYRDPYFGHQFFYPASWAEPGYDPAFCNADVAVLCAANPAGTQWLYVYTYPDLAGSAADLRAQTLRDFGAVSVRYEDEVTAGDGEPMLRTAYSYAGDAGPRTGIFLTAIRDGVGYVLDLDGAAELEQETVALAATLAQSWGVEPAGFGRFPGQWSTLDRTACAVAYPAGYDFRESGGWCVFNGGGGTFIALRREPAGADENGAAVLARWLATTDDQPGFSAGDPTTVALADAVWERVEFTWEDDGSRLRGYIMVTRAAEAWVIAWAEAPASSFPDAEQSVFAVMVADYVR